MAKIDIRNEDKAAMRLAAVVESSDDAIVSQAIDGSIETWNRAAERMFGFPRTEAIGQPIDLIVSSERADEERDVFARVLRGETVHHFETEARTRDGSSLPISLTVSPVLTPDGQLIGVSRIIRDISLRKRLEREALRLAAIVDSSDDAIISKDLNGIVQTWNKAAERMFGYAAGDIIGKPITTVIPDERLHEETEVLGRIRKGVSIEHFETVRKRKDGSLVDISLTVSPIRTANGEIIGASKIARDTSRQRTMEREAMRLAAIVNSSEDAIVSKDLNGIVQTWNKAAERMFGYTADEIIGRSIRTIIPAERMSEEDKVLARIRAGVGIEHFETVRQRKDGTLIEISLSVSPIRAPGGRVIGASKIARDISSQRQLARALEEANRVKDEFLATLSHELRTPLNAVLGYTRMLRTGQIGEDRQGRAIDIIERNANILSQLVGDVLDVSSIVTGKITLNLADCDLVSICTAGVDMIRPSADAKGVAVHLHNATMPLKTKCDSARMQQVLWNVLSNAVKFTPKGGRIDVALAVASGMAQIAITDTGVGIAPDVLPHIFQRFWQGDPTATREVGGLGLGLALARHFVELHGGTITADSKGEGHGTTFTIRIPLSF